MEKTSQLSIFDDLDSGESTQRSMTTVQRTILHSGGGLRWVYNRNLMLGLGVSIALHLLLLLYVLISQDPTSASKADVMLPPLPSPSNDTTLVLIDMNKVKVGGGGGGSPDQLDKPEGKAKQGAPDAKPQYVPNKPPVKSNEVVIKNPTKVVVSNRERSTKVPTTDHDSAKGHSGTIGNRGQHPDGTGTQYTSGSGGPGIGKGQGKGVGDYGVSGFGGRGWASSPRAVYPSGSNATGRVTLRFTVLPSGDITNITPAGSGSPELLRAAMAGLRKARARPLPDGVPQVVQKATITYTFVLK